MSEHEHEPTPEQNPDTPPGGDQPGAPPPPAEELAPTKDDRNMAMLAHLSALAGYVIPFGNIIGPLIVWMIKREQSAFVDDQGKEAVNFQITVTIAAIIASVLICVGIGLVLLPIVAIVALVMIIIAAVKANGGEKYRYPLTIRLIT